MNNKNRKKRRAFHKACKKRGVIDRNPSAEADEYLEKLADLIDGWHKHDNDR